MRAGHGSQKRDWSGDERDGMNETICPTDFRQAGQIIDDELNRHLVNPLGDGVRLHALLDACHSGTGMDLRHVTKLDKRTGVIRWKDEGATRCGPPPRPRAACICPPSEYHQRVACAVYDPSSAAPGGCVCWRSGGRLSGAPTWCAVHLCTRTDGRVCVSMCGCCAGGAWGC